MNGLWRNISIHPDGCWHWTGYVGSDGYGYRYRKAGTRLVHRLVYSEFKGAIPEGLTLDHLCRVRRCVNPAHLEPVTNRENVLRGVSSPARNAARDVCVNGHALTPDNVFVRKQGWRACRECGRERWRAWRASH